MAISKLIMYDKIESLVNNVKQDPENTEEYMRACNDALREYTSSQVKSALVTMFVSLFDGQIRSLKLAIAQCVLSGGKTADPSERIELLRCLFGALSLYFKDDYSLLTNMCEEELERRIKYGEGIEDSEEEEMLEL